VVLQELLNKTDWFSGSIVWRSI